MPITRDNDGALLLQFGTGDIAVCPARHPANDRPNEIIFHGGPPGELGRDSSEGIGQTTAELGAPLRMQFVNTASLQVVIEVFQELKRRMDGVTTDQ